MKLQGAMTALVTPFDNGEVDWDAFEKLIEHQIENGIQGLIPCGTTGESPTLSHDEHKKVIEFTVQKSNGRVPVIAGTGSNSTDEAVQLTAHAKNAGVDACLIVNPYYNKPTQEGMFRHMAKLGEVGVPLVLYNIPGRTGIELTPDTIVRMYNEIDTVVAVKEATGGVDTAGEVASRCDITVLSGDDSLTLPMSAVGGSGVISVLANILPAEVRKLCDLIAANDLAGARQQHQKLLPLFDGMFVETNPIPIKAAMAMAGMMKNELRLPMVQLSEPCRKPLMELLEPFGLNLTL